VPAKCTQMTQFCTRVRGRAVMTLKWQRTRAVTRLVVWGRGDRASVAVIPGSPLAVRGHEREGLRRLLASRVRRSILAYHCPS
jgi:hypothetical protein